MDSVKGKGKKGVEEDSENCNEAKRVITLTKPTSLEGESDAADYKAPNLLQRILVLFKDVRPGSNLSSFQLPPHFNMPKSQLQCYGEALYCFNDDMLSKCNTGNTPSERFLAVVSWTISTFRPVIFGISPYNPILGETHHVSSATLNVLLEQVSHHPPVTALSATDETENLEILWCQYPCAEFHGTSVEVEICGKRQLKLLNHGETYIMNSPKLSFKFLPSPGAEWSGSIKIKCLKNGLEADLCCKGLTFFGRRGNTRSIKGKIFDTSTSKQLYEIDGHWDRTLKVKDMDSGKVNVIFNAKEVMPRLKTPIVVDPKGVKESESAVVWGEVSQGIMSKDWEKARRAKREVEEKQRELARERLAKGQTWVPNHFTVCHSKESGWDCLPIHKLVPPAPIMVPL